MIVCSETIPSLVGDEDDSPVGTRLPVLSSLYFYPLRVIVVPKLEASKEAGFYWPDAGTYLPFKYLYYYPLIVTVETNYEAWSGDTVYPLIVVVVTEVLMVFAPGGHNNPLFKE